MNSTYISSLLSTRTARPAVDAIIDALVSGENATGDVTVAADRLAAILAAYSTPESRVALRLAMSDDYGMPDTLTVVAEIITSPDGRCWESDPRLVLLAGDVDRHVSPESRADLVSRVISLLTAETQIDTAPITDTHAWWIRLTEEQRMEYVRQAVELDGEARARVREDYAVVIDVHSKGMWLWAWEDMMDDDLLVCAYRKGVPTDRVGMSTPEAARLSICGAAGVA